MSIDPDYLVERNKNKKQLAKWKFLALGLVIVTLASIVEKFPQVTSISLDKTEKRDHIASIKIQEIILDDLAAIRGLEAIEKNDRVKALVVHINSPGGSVVGSEMLYNSLRKISKRKPVVVVMGSLAASGGYLVALAGDYIVAHNGTLTGSIGVIMQTAEVTDLAEKLGIKFENFKSDTLKASPNPTERK